MTKEWLKKLQRKGLTKMTEVEMIKMCVVLVPMACIMLVALIGGIIEIVSDYKHRNDCKGEDWQALLKYMTKED